MIYSAAAGLQRFFVEESPASAPDSAASECSYSPSNSVILTATDHRKAMICGVEGPCVIAPTDWLRRWFRRAFPPPTLSQITRKNGHPSFVCDLGFADEWVGHPPK